MSHYLDDQIISKCEERFVNQPAGIWEEQVKLILLVWQSTSHAACVQPCVLCFFT